MNELQPLQPLHHFAQLVPDQGGLLLRQLVSAAVVLVLLFFAYRWLARLLATLEARGRLSRHTYVILRRVCYWTLSLFAVLLILQQFGLMDNAWATLTAVLALIAIGFVAVWSVLSNAFCAIILMIARPFDVGDTIELPADNLRGKVIDFNLIFTTLRDANGSLLQVPNNVFFQKVIRREIGTTTVTLDQQADREEPTE